LGWLVTLIAPIINSIVYFGKKFVMTYVLHNLAENYYTFYSAGQYGMEATIGIRIEIAAVILLTSLYIATKTRSWFRTTIAALGIYTITFFYMSYRLAISKLFELSSINYYLIYPRDFAIGFGTIMLILGIIWIILHKKSGIKKFIIDTKHLLEFKQFKINKEAIKSLFKNIRPFRLIHYSFLVFIGIMLGAYYTNSSFSDISILKIIFLLISLSFAWLFAVGINDLFDRGIDRISNRYRPLIQKELTPENHKIFTLIFFAFSLIFAFLVHFYAASIIFYFMLAYSFIYSGPPYKLKRFFFIPNIVIGLCSLMAVLFGTSLLGEASTFTILPFPIPLLVFLVYSFGSTLKDIKDYKGDKENNIQTIPVVFGKK